MRLTVSTVTAVAALCLIASTVAEARGFGRSFGGFRSFSRPAPVKIAPRVPQKTPQIAPKASGGTSVPAAGKNDGVGGSGVSAGGLAGDLIGGAVAGAAGAMVFNALSGDEKPEEKAGEEVKP